MQPWSWTGRGEESGKRKWKWYMNAAMLKTPPERVDSISTYAKHLRDIIKERGNHPSCTTALPSNGFQVSLCLSQVSPLFSLSVLYMRLTRASLICYIYLQGKFKPLKCVLVSASLIFCFYKSVWVYFKKCIML
jgi:hypothetical protein